MDATEMEATTPEPRRRRLPLRPGPSEWGKRRVQADLSQRELERLSGVPRATISLIESGRLLPTPGEAAKLLAVLTTNG